MKGNIMAEIEFVKVPSIPRYSREVIVTEKIDGTNASIYIGEDGEFLVGSRKRWITPDNDNYGFARWAYANVTLLRQLGTGHHFGEWWGSGINRNYGLVKGEKRFSLFNTLRWCLYGNEPRIKSGIYAKEVKYQDILPPGIGLVPELWRGNFDDMCATTILENLQNCGSLASPGFTNPEGIVIFHVAGRLAFKKTLDNDGIPKSLLKENKCYS